MEYRQKLQVVKAIYNDGTPECAQRAAVVLGKDCHVGDGGMIIVHLSDINRQYVSKDIWVFMDVVFDNCCIFTDSQFKLMYEEVKPEPIKGNMFDVNEELLESMCESKFTPLRLPEPVFSNPIDQAKELVDFIMGHINADKVTLPVRQHLMDIPPEVKQSYLWTLELGACKTHAELNALISRIPEGILSPIGFQDCIYTQRHIINSSIK
jgi:hypothetical protein